MASKNQLTTSDYLEYSEYERLLECLHKDGEIVWELYARLSFCTACRASDVLNFRWKDVLNKDYGTITERKTGKTRCIKFNTSVKRRINLLYELMESPDPDDYIFKSVRTGRSYTIQNVNKRLKDFKWKYKIKIDNFSTHTFRKTFGRYVYELNNRSAESLILLNKILNHTSIQITKTYIGITQDEINGIFDSIKF